VTSSTPITSTGITVSGDIKVTTPTPPSPSLSLSSVRETIHQWLDLSTLAMLSTGGNVRDALIILGIKDDQVLDSLMDTAINMMCEGSMSRASTLFAIDPMDFMESLFLRHFKHLIPLSSPPCPSVADRSASLIFVRKPTVAT
jgi:hypothetical protein